MIGDDGGPEEPRELEAAVAVGSDHHGDFDALIAQPGDASGPFALDGGAAFERQAELGEEGDGVVERLHGDADVVHPHESAVGHGFTRVPAMAPPAPSKLYTSTRQPPL